MARTACSGVTGATGAPCGAVPWPALAEQREKALEACKVTFTFLRDPVVAAVAAAGAALPPAAAAAHGPCDEASPTPPCSSLCSVPGGSVPAVQTVRMPIECAELHGGAAYFAIEVTPKVGRSWQVMRCYSDFCEFADALGTLATWRIGAPFPRAPRLSAWLDRRPAGTRVDAQRHDLEVWLRAVSSHANSQTQWAGALHRFLCPGCEQAPQGPAVQGGEAAHPHRPHHRHLSEPARKGSDRRVRSPERAGGSKRGGMDRE